MSDEPMLRPEEVAGVLSGVDGEKPPEPPVAVDGPRPYSLREPVAIPPEAEETAKEALEAIARAIQEGLSGALDSAISFEIDGLQQLRVSAAISVLPSPVWVASFAREGGGGAALVLPSVLAMCLVEMALGGSGKPPEEGREPTGLESRVFVRLCSTASNRVGEILRGPIASNMLSIDELPTVVATPGETVGVGHLRVRVGEEDSSGLMLATAAMLVPASRTGPAEFEARIGPLAARLERVAVDVRPVLKAGRVSLGDLLQLEGGKILHLDAPETAPLQLVVAGCPCFTGHIHRPESGPVFAVTRRRGSRSGDGGKSNEQ